MTGPLTGVRIVELAGLGPVPFAGMLLADMGADVVRIERHGVPPASPEVVDRGRRIVAADLKSRPDIEMVLGLIDHADALIEGFRPGVIERLGLDPKVLLARAPRLVIGRMTGWGQTGPLSHVAGHDLNYIAISGALAAIGPKSMPVVPLNLVGDYGGGAMYLAMGVLAAIISARMTGRGQVIDCAMCDGAASLMSPFYQMMAAGRWQNERAANFIDGGSHFYCVYECSDGKFVTIGAIEQQFYVMLLEKVGLKDDVAFLAQNDRAAWPELRERLAQVFATRTRDEWCAVLEGSDACFAPVLALDESPRHPHNVVRNVFVSRDGATVPAPAPRFLGTPSTARPSSRDQSLQAIRDEWARTDTTVVGGDLPLFRGDGL